ncbi:MAG: DUF4430 domain-containing protein [Desulfurispora sp.]|uniref:DUF4430 domain-containing protein n=1 Tax=Desulfurispora sp. TaxID=3014275 RepID=UPI00404A45B7
MNRRSNALIYLVPLLFILVALLGPLFYNYWQDTDRGTALAGPEAAQQIPETGAGTGSNGQPVNTASRVDAGPGAGSAGGVGGTAADGGSGLTVQDKGEGKPGSTGAYPAPGAAGQGSGAERNGVAGSVAGGATAGSTTARPPASPGGADELGREKSGYDRGMVGLAVVGRQGELLFGPALLPLPAAGRTPPTALDVLDLAGLGYQLSSRFPGFVTAIAGQENKGQAGWMYKVNQEIPAVTADRKTLQPGDKVIWWYSNKMGDPVPVWEELKR